MNRFVPRLLAALACLTLTPAFSQTSYFNQGFLRQPSAEADRAYLGIGGTGSGTVTNLDVANFPPLFTTTVTTPNTFPHVSFTAVSQSANLFFGGPTTGAATTPTFRALVAADFPFAVLSVTNAAQPLVGVSLINTFTAPVPSFKSISAGANVTVTDLGTSITISASSGGGSVGGSDLSLTNDTPFSGNTNFYVDFNWQSHVFQANSNIVFNYATNWAGSSATSRVSTVTIPATNYLRHVYFKTAATNWHTGPYTIYNVPAFRSAKIVFQAFGQGDTNVTMTPFIDEKNDGTLTNLLDLSSLAVIPSATNVLWVDATRGVFQDYLMTTPIQEGGNVLGWSDLGGQGNNLTNNTTTFNSIFFHNAATAPFNVPCLTIMPTYSTLNNTWLRSVAVTKVTQPVWVFFVAYANKTPSAGANVIDSISGTTTRMLCTAAFQGGTMTIASANTSSFSVTNNLSPQWELFAFKFNSTTSQILTNAVSIQTNNAGTGVGNGFTFGSDVVNTVPSSSTSIAELAVFWGNLTAADLGNIQTNYFMPKYGIGR